MNSLRQTAQQGDASAQYTLGVMYENGEGVVQNFVTAVKWYRKGAKQGDEWAQYTMGRVYESGQGAPQDMTNAASWYRKAAEQALFEKRCEVSSASPVT